MKFPKGTRVYMTRGGRKLFPNCPISGIVATRSKYPGFVTVLLDGRKRATCWSETFWTAMQAGERT